MKLFVFTPYRNYSFGSTIVAANSLDQAWEVLRSDGDHLINYVGISFSEILEGVTAEGQPRIVHTTSGLE